MIKPVKIAAVIPAYNEAPRIRSVVQALQQISEVEQIIVCDNQSTDNTSQEAEKAGATVIYERQRGYGSACLTGISIVDPGINAVLFVNADGAEVISEARLLIDALQYGELVVGSREKGLREKHALLPQQRLGNKLACFLINRLWGQHFTDLGPFRLIRRATLNKLAMSDKDFGWIIEMQLKAIRAQCRIVEVPVTTRCSAEPSKIAGTFSGFIGASSKILGAIFFYGMLDGTEKLLLPFKGRRFGSRKFIRRE